jgi:septal ring factor EnvC (AmiA/AmiB activator)
VREGTVICVVRRAGRRQTGWGTVIVVRHTGGIVSWYGDLKRATVKDGSRVEKGQFIGTARRHARTGRRVVALRFFKDERPADPRQYLP